MTRAWRICVFGLTVPVVIGASLVVARLHAEPVLLRNVTPSMPLGLYRRTDRPVAVDEVVAVRQPAPARSYLRGLGFPAGARLLKRVALVWGDPLVCAWGERVTARGLDLDRLDRDRLGQALPRWNGCHRIGADELFLKGDDPRSFDSRYFGLVRRRDVIGVYEHLP